MPFLNPITRAIPELLSKRGQSNFMVPASKNSKFRQPFARRCLLLSMGFFLWWFIWPLLSLNLTRSLTAEFTRLYGGLPLWFWLSSVASLPLLFVASLLFLPKDNNDKS